MMLHVYIVSIFRSLEFFVSVSLICLCACICGSWWGGCVFVCLYVYEMCLGPYGSPLECGGQRTTLWSRFSSSTFMWVPNINYRLSGLLDKPHYSESVIGLFFIFICLERSTAAPIIQGVTSVPGTCRLGSYLIFEEKLNLSVP